MRHNLRRSGGTIRVYFCVLLLALGGCGHSARTESRPLSALSSAPPAGWGIDACLTAHAPKEERGAYLQLLQGSGVGWLRERGPNPGMAQLKEAEFRVVSFLGDLHAGTPRVADALPEDLMAVFNGARELAKSSEARAIDAWEMIGEPDVGYCTDLPDRVAAFQKAVYLGIKAGAAEAGGQRTDDGGRMFAGPEGPRAVDQPADSGRGRTELSALNLQPAASPSPLVLMGALALPPGPWLERAMKNGLLEYTDAYNFHFYGHAEDLAGVIAAHARVAKRVSSSAIRHRFFGFHPQISALPLWITECGINAVPTDDFLNSRRRKLQSEFTTKTAEQALAAPQVAVFMPFIFIHENDPHTMAVSASQPLPAWDTYARFTREHPWPTRTLAAPPSSPNPIVLQWMPDNSTTQAHKVSGSYRFFGSGSIRGELRIYNFSDQPVQGRLTTGALQRLRQDMMIPDTIELRPMSSQAIPLTFSRGRSTGYVYENWSADFRDDAGRHSSVAFAFETNPEEEVRDFVEVPLALASVGERGSTHRFDPGDAVTVRGTVWQGVNGITLKELPATHGAGSRLQISVTEPRSDPLRAKLAVARLMGGLPASGFLRVRLDRPMDREFALCIDLVDRLGQRFSIWENMGVSYFRPQSTDVWLNLADFAPYFWGRCTADPRLKPADVEEIQCRFYLSNVNDPREISLALMTPRKSSK